MPGPCSSARTMQQGVAEHVISEVEGEGGGPGVKQTPHFLDFCPELVVFGVCGTMPVGVGR